MSETPMQVGKHYTLLHLSRQLRASVEVVESVLNVESMERGAAENLRFNELGQVIVHTTKPLIVDPYSQNRSTGGFILVDPGTNVPVAAGTVESFSRVDTSLVAPERIWTRQDRERRNGHRASPVWVEEGVPESAVALFEWSLDQQGIRTAVLASPDWALFVENGIVPILLGQSPEAEGIVLSVRDAADVLAFADRFVDSLRS